MRIAHVTDFYLPRLGGIEMHVHDLATRQAAMGHDVTVITSSPSQGADAGRSDGVDVIRLTDHLRLPGALHPRAAFSGAAALHAGDFDVAHVHVGVCSPLGFWAARAASGRGLPTVVTVHSMWAGVRPIFRSLDLPGGWSRRPICWTTVSEAAAGPVRRMLTPGHSITTLSNGIDLDAWKIDHQPRRSDHVALVAVMRLAARKRGLALLDMVRTVRETTPREIGIELTIIGDGPQRAAMRDYVQRHRMESYVDLAGRQTRERIREHFARADAFLAPADLESFGIAALEARAAGLPVVAKAASGISEFVRSGENGLLAGSDKDMTDAIRALCVNPALRESLRGTGGTEHLGWPSVLGRTFEAYARAAHLVGRDQAGIAS